ncbi:hypothetical protein K503DRAFT_728175 [Rhizopogon vinicolor AM-OR11-026]|uniref:Uncharacterized protein n=1 Tax=Rhizopogon vinicolor AM-OR11-026 TaxID=1314800 RepID=A0A1B7ME16_9AGAM|nr:hypothetical protein K503DRAFT_728175 [Rhizopogon vinicolor AM-OR11-026]
MSGFRETTTTVPLAATLLANAVEIAESLVTPKSHKKWGRSLLRQRSADSPRETTAKSSPSSAQSPRACTRRYFTRPYQYLVRRCYRPHHGVLALICHLRAQAGAAYG